MPVRHTLATGNMLVLESLRSFVGGWIAKVLLVLLVASFAVWGISGNLFHGGYSNSVASVGQTAVGVRDFLGTYQSNLNRLQQQLQQRLTTEQARLFGVERQTLSQTLSFATMDEFSREMGISLSDQTLAELIGRNTQFHDSTGTFSRDRFRQAVIQAQMQERDFVDNQNRAAIRGQVAQAVVSGNLVPDVYKNALSSYAAEERKFNYITINAAVSGEPAAPDDSQLNEYFSANKEKYKAPEYRKISILSLEPKDIAAQNPVSDEEAKADYDARKTSYEQPEKRRVQQIVFSSKEKADAAAKDLAEGGLFESVLNENNVKLSDADLGLVSRDALPQALQETAFQLEQNAVSEVIDGPFGPTLLRVTEIEEGKTTPFETVKQEIKTDLALRKAVDQIIVMQETIEDIRAGGASLAETANQVNLKTREINAIDATARDPDGAIISDIPSSSQLLRQAFDTEVGSQASPIDIGSTGYVWYEVQEITPSRERTLNEVKQRVTDDWLADERASAVSKKTDELITRLKKGEALEAIASETGVEIQTTDFLKRNGQATGFPPTATQAGFGGDAKHVVNTPAINAGEQIIVTIAEIKRPEAQQSPLPEGQSQLANREAADDILTQLIANLQSGYEVTYNQPLIQQALTRR